MSIGRTRLTDIVADVGAIAADTDGIDGSENDKYGFFGERGEDRLDLP